MKAKFYSTNLVIFLIVLSGLSFKGFSQSATFNYTGSMQTWTVPAGVTSVNIDMQGATGGANNDWPDGTYPSSGGYGGRVQCTLTVTPGQVLNIFVGGRGGQGTDTTGGTAGYNDPGAVGTWIVHASPATTGDGGGGGGGATDIRIGDLTLAGRVVVAGGGGGAGLTGGSGSNLVRGGDGGGLTGQAAYNGGVSSPGLGSGGGTQTSGGATYGGFGQDGTLGYGGAGGYLPFGTPANGGGGGGYYGGAGGLMQMGGGGGSSYTDPILATNVTNTQGYNSAGDGVVVITMTPPTFAGGDPQSLILCENNGTDISSRLAANDVDSGLTLTWTVTSGPTNGIVGGVPTTAASSGSTVTPSGITYTPNTDFSGTDAFTVQVDDGSGGTATTTFNVTVNPLPSLSIDSVAAACFGSTSTTISYSAVANMPFVTTTFPFSGSVQTWTVPDGIHQINISAAGAQGGTLGFGGAVGGAGATMTGDIVVVPGHVLSILVGGQGAGALYVAGGGGGSFVWDNTSNTLLIAAGGGGGAGTNVDADLPLDGINASTGLDGVNGNTMTSGAGTAGNGGVIPAGYTTWAAGGAGWLSNGNDGTPEGCSLNSTGGATPLTGGAGGTGGGEAGTSANGGFGGGGGGNARCTAIGGGGGGGYSGGGAGGEVVFGNYFPGGGGGGSYNIGTNQSNSVGNTGNGQIVISYPIGTFNIVWDATAHGQGFTDLTNDTLTATPVTIPVSGTAAAGAYNGILTLDNGSCTSVGYPITVTINPTPSVDPVGSQIVCNGATTTSIIFTGSAVPGTTYNWTNNLPGIGIPASGTDSIGSFAAVNSSNIPVVDTIIVTPVANGCPGPTQTFSITVNPTPDVNPSDNQIVCNGAATTSIVFSGSVAATTFNWINDSASIGSGAAGVDSIPSFIAVNDSAFAVSGSFIVTGSANGCVGTSNSFTITVDPTPKLSSLLALTICDSTSLTYSPMSATTGTTYSWSRDTVPGISNAAGAGDGDVNETLVNTTDSAVTAVYVYTLTANSCPNTQNVAVTVYPRPTLSTPVTPSAVCDSTLFNYGPGGTVAGTTFTWSRALVPGISNMANSGIDTISEYLVNTTDTQVTVVYVDTLMANGCSNTENISVIVNPKPMLAASASAPSICDSTLFTYVPGSTVSGTTFAWSRAAITGISNPAASGGDTISETLNDTTVNPILVVYVDTLTANGCSNTENITVTVNPKPTLSSPLSAAQCDSAIFNYVPTSGTTGATFAWERPFVLGIALPARSGTGNPVDTLYNTSNSNVDVTYIYTITANGCSNTEDVTVLVHPTPTLSSPLTQSVCSGAPLSYLVSGFVFGTTFAWTRPHVAGILPSTNSGTGNIDEVLTDTALVPIHTIYNYTLTANGCSHVQTVNVTVNPAPPALDITTHSPSSVCSNTQFQNFGTSVPPSSTLEYSWSAVNATIWATGSTGQYILVSFPNPGDAVISVNSNVSGIACPTNSSYTVHVGTGVSETPSVIYFNGQFLCLRNGEDSYQWGYDDGVTLDSTLIAGEINQNYFISGPDLSYRHYWVITTHDGCMQKSYFNAPTGITNVNADLTDVKIYPNPTSNLINVNINTTESGNFEIHILNLLGQQLSNTAAIDHKAQINVANLPGGCYLVDCYRDGVKIATARFVKN